MRRLFIVLSFCFIGFSSMVFAQAYTTAETDIGTLLDDPAAAEIIERHLPGFTTNGQVSMTRALTLVSLQSFAPQMVTEEALEKIDADLAALGEK